MALFTCMALFMAEAEGSGSEAEQARRVESVWLLRRSREREGGAVLLGGGCMEEEENGPTPMHMDTACWSMLAHTGSRSSGAEAEGKLVRGRVPRESRSEAEGKLVRGPMRRGEAGPRWRGVTRGRGEVGAGSLHARETAGRRGAREMAGTVRGACLASCGGASGLSGRGWRRPRLLGAGSREKRPGTCMVETYARSLWTHARETRVSWGLGELHQRLRGARTPQSWQETGAEPRGADSEDGIRVEGEPSPAGSGAEPPTEVAGVERERRRLSPTSNSDRPWSWGRCRKRGAGNRRPKRTKELGPRRCLQDSVKVEAKCGHCNPRGH